MSEEDEGMKSGGEEETLPATSGERRMARYNSEPPDLNGTAKPPTSSSWVQWWRRRGANSYSRVPDQVSLTSFFLTFACLLILVLANKAKDCP